MEKTIRAAQFMYFVPTGEERLNRKTGQMEEVLAVRHAFFGDTVDIPREQDVKAGEEGGAFSSGDDQAADEQVAVATDEPDFSSHDALVAWFENTRPSVKKVVAAAEDDPDKAEALLLAENTATGGQPRKGVRSGLETILEEEDDE